MIKVLLVIVAAASVVAATTSTLFERFQRFESAQRECQSSDAVVDNKQKLDLCGFVLLPDSLAINDEALDEYIFNALGLDMSTLHEVNGTTQIQSFHSLKLQEAINTPTGIGIVQTDTHEVRANFLAGNSQFEGEWTHVPFLYEQKVLRKSGLGFYDVGSAVRHDLIVPWLALQQFEHGADSPVAICVASHYITGVTLQECDMLMDAADKQACLLVASGQCPHWAVLRPKAMQRGTGILIDSRTLRQVRGSDFDPRKIRVFLQAVHHVAGWLKQGVEEEEATCSNVEPQLWFGNVNVLGDRVELYRGNYELVSELPVGSNVTIQTIPGIYTLRADGRVKKAWQVASQEVQAVFYAKI